MLPQGIVLKENDLINFVDYALTQEEIFFDVETTGENRVQPQVAPVSHLSIATKGSAIVIPLDHPIGELVGTEKVPTQYKTGKNAGKYYNKTVNVYSKPPEQLERGFVFETIAPLFANPNIRKGAHDGVFDIVAVAKYLGFVPVPPYDDSKIGYWLLDENSRQNSYLKPMIEKRYGFRYDDENIGKCVESHPFSKVGYYSYCDSKFGRLCLQDILERIDEEGLRPIYNLEMQVLNVMVGMRLAGVRIDVPKLKELREELKVKLVEQEGVIYQAAGHTFNINSNQQKAEVLYNEQGLKPWKLTKGGEKKKKLGQHVGIYDYSTDADTLETYPDNPVAQAYLDYSKTQKVFSSYVESWLGNNGEPSLIFDDYIHAGFQQYGTVTGRFSCRAPNLQNPPRPSTYLGKAIRDLFIAEPGGKLIVADYSQIELVVLAHYIGEGRLYEGFLQGIDPHTLTAAMITSKLIEEVTKDERQNFGKTPNFAIVYGAGLGKVASLAHTDMKGAKRILSRHATMFPEVHSFKGHVIDLARSRKPVPYITTLLGRKRRIPELNSRNDGIRMSAERQIFNSLIQGGAGDLIKLAMVRLDAVLPPETKIVLCVHDEIVVSCPEHMAEQVAEMVRNAMTGPGIQKLLRVPLTIDLKIVDRWSEAK